MTQFHITLGKLIVKFDFKNKDILGSIVERDGESVKPQRCRAHSMYYNVGGITRLYERDPIFEKSTAHDISFDTIFSCFKYPFKFWLA